MAGIVVQRSRAQGKKEDIQHIPEFLTFKAESYVNQPSHSDAVLAEISPTLIEVNFAKSLRDNVNVKDVIDTDVRHTFAMTE
eukprot:10484465-Ditylum_brightwellii.AAC.1